ncbi:hypothetical protein EAH87_02660 [Sphingomonas koreensis]|nr:hypothetical protein EAH87_02660 [Sphingomonas koreensis]
MSIADSPANPERALALSYVVRGRPAAEAIFALDDRLAAILRRTSDPLVGQMRLTWWHEALIALDGAPPSAEPALEALARDVLPLGVAGRELAAIVDGWEAALEDPIGEETLTRYAGRGRAVFEAVGRVIGADDAPIGAAGEGWALADFAGHVRDPAVAAAAAAMATALLDAALAGRWSRPGRALGAMAHLARLDLRGVRQTGTPRRIARMLRHRLTGR